MCDGVTMLLFVSVGVVTS